MRKSLHIKNCNTYNRKIVDGQWIIPCPSSNMSQCSVNTPHKNSPKFCYTFAKVCFSFFDTPVQAA